MKNYIYNLLVLTSFVLILNSFYLISNAEPLWTQMSNGMENDKVAFSHTLNNKIIGFDRILIHILPEISLRPKYPNPFNPNTIIRFQIPPCHSSGSWGYPLGHPVALLKVYVY